MLAISAAALVAGIFDLLPLPFDAVWVAIVLCGVPIILEAVIGLVTAFDIKENVLVSIALIAPVVIREDFAAGEVAFIMQLGALPRVLPGKTVPVDGVIGAGQTSINQAFMTGESLPVDKAPGDEVSSGTVNQFGSFDMEATKVGGDSSIQRIIRLVQSADAGKAKIIGLADRCATRIVVIVLSAAALTWFVTGEPVLLMKTPCGTSRHSSRSARSMRTACRKTD